MAKNVSDSEHGKNENTSTFGLASAPKLDVLMFKKGYTSIAGEFTAVGGHL